LSDDIDEVEDSEDEAPKSPSANETFEFDHKAEKAQTKKLQEKLKKAQKTRTPVKRRRRESDDEAEQEEEEEDLATKVQDLVERKTKRRRSTVNDSPGGAWKSCLSGTPTKGKFTAAENKILMDAIQAFCAVRMHSIPFFLSDLV